MLTKWAAMDIIFKSKKLEKICNSEKEMLKQLGERRSKLLKRRLTELYSANTLEDIKHLPQARCHELKGSLKGVLSVDLDHPYRLLFEPAHNPLPVRADGGLDWSKVTKIKILEIKDTHE